MTGAPLPLTDITYIPPFAKSAKDGAPGHLWLVEISTTKGGPPAYFKPKAGILGGIILVGMFFTTSTMLITTPDDTVVVNGIHYMNNLGLFLFKDIIAFGVAFYLISYYGRKAIMAENQR